MGEERNVRQFKDFILKESDLDPIRGHFKFCLLSEAHKAFWIKINKLWDPNQVASTEVPDVDAATPLTDERWQRLEDEFRQLPDVNPAP